MWDAFQDAIFAVLHWFYTLAGDWGVAIILITILFRILIYPITRKQFKSTYAMQKLQPQINAINEKYADDPARKQEETMKVYQEAKFNPLSGCLPMLLQMPIMIALFWVLRELTTRAAAAGLPADMKYTFYNIISDISKTPNDMFTAGMSVYNQLGQFFVPGGVEAVYNTDGAVLSTSGLVSAIPYVILLVLFGASMFIPTLLNKQAQNQKQMRIMMGVMTGFMLFIGWSMSAGVLLYWVVSSYIGVGQQIGSRYMLKKKDEREEAELIDVTPAKVEVDRKERKARPRKKN
ncbi:MAG: YidC/Oxa1 family membrane protein insertase [Coriobacteriales bacterium]|nr:YidC/Oxa1 family membrane protein insertase [Coriobacteriales bacterium]